MDILKFAKKFYETLYTKETTATTAFLTKIPNREKISNEQFNLCEAKISLDEIIKSINSQANESLGKDRLTTKFYKYFSNKLALVILDVYDSWGKLDTMDVTSRPGMISVIYKKGDKKMIGDCKLQTHILQFLRINCKKYSIQ